MAQIIRYQVFVSSTYEDLREERQQATQAILEAGCFPSGMELFPASDDAQWALIKRVIEECDYYVVIIAGRYGSLAPDGLSYTEKEYDYAVERGIPVLGFIRDKVGEVSFDKTEKTDANREKLDAFRRKVMSRICRKYTSPVELGMAVMKSLMSEVRIRPRGGWVRADQARSEEDVVRERKLVSDLAEAKERVEELERDLRDGAILGTEVPRDSLAQGDDACVITVSYTGDDKKQVREDVELTWDQVLKVIGPPIYGYIIGRRTSYGENGTYSFQDNLEEHIRTKIIDRVQNRKIKIESSQIDAIVLQFKELGLLSFQESKQENGRKYRGVILTYEGEKRLSMLSMKPRAEKSHAKK